MTAQLIDGKLIGQQVRDEVAAAVAKRTAAGKRKPTLATVLVGDRPDSAAYVASKGKACQELGMGSVGAYSSHLMEMRFLKKATGMDISITVSFSPKPEKE